MSGGLAGGIAQAAANTAFLAKGDEIFNGAPSGLVQLFADVISIDGQSLELDGIGPSPAVTELLGTRLSSNLRAYARQYAVKPYTVPLLELSRATVELDKTGAVARRLAGMLAGVANFWDKPATDALLANGTCIDGVSLISASHPFSSSGSTWSNNAAAALSPSTFESGISAMTGLLLENGEPAGVYPTHLMVGPALRKMGTDLTKSDLRSQPLAATGLEAYASAVAATAISNWKGGMPIELIVNPRMVGTYANGWCLLDLSKPGVRPFVVGEAIKPQAFVVDDPGMGPRYNASKIGYYVEGYAAMGAHIPHVIYGSFTGS